MKRGPRPAFPATWRGNLRREIGQEAIWCKPRTSIPDDGHRKYPYLLRNLTIDRPDQVWCADITYVPMPRGHVNPGTILQIVESEVEKLIDQTIQAAGSGHVPVAEAVVRNAPKFGPVAQCPDRRLFPCGENAAEPQPDNVG